MKAKIILALVIVLGVALCGCQNPKNPFVQEMSSAAFWSEAQVALAGPDSATIDKIPSTSEFPFEIWYSVPDKFKWEKGHYEKLFVKNNNEEWQEIFSASPDAKAMAGMHGHKGDILRGLAAENPEERAYSTVDGRTGTLKKYSISTAAKTLYFKVAVFDSQGRQLLEKTKALYSPFALNLKVFSKSGAELAKSISAGDFPIKVCYDWQALDKWQY
ncbi:MAG: hypothetical protein PHH08_03985, partial [Candidatus ainarchaeum sp.]|nr:hypothetical protein [Candidatus ainarchaeum sp.]